LNPNVLPNFFTIINEGFSSNLKVTIPPLTIPSWPCLFSGLTPEKLKYYAFDHPKMGLFNSYIWRDKSIFSIIKQKSFILNVPGTYPAWKINGEMITGMMSPKFSSYPIELKFFLENNWIIDGNSLPMVFKAFEIKKKLFLKKMDEDFQFLTYVIRLPDSISHNSALDRRMLTNYILLGYKKIDDFLGELLKSENFDNLIIFSDHGLKFYNFDFSLRRWLEKNRLIYINNTNKGKIFTIIAKIYDIFRPFIKIDYKKYKKLKRTILKDIIDDSITTIKDRNKSRVIHFSSNVGGLFLCGKDKLKKALIYKKLLKEKRIKQVILEDLDGFPDMFIILDEKYYFNQQSSLFITRGRNTIGHSELGFFMAYGKNIKKGKKDLINYLNVAPTILKLFKIEKKDYMEGESLNIIK